MNKNTYLYLLIAVLILVVIAVLVSQKSNDVEPFASALENCYNPYIGIGSAPDGIEGGCNSCSPSDTKSKREANTRLINTKNAEINAIKSTLGDCKTATATSSCRFRWVKRRSRCRRVKTWRGWRRRCHKWIRKRVCTSGSQEGVDEACVQRKQNEIDTKNNDIASGLHDMTQCDQCMHHCSCKCGFDCSGKSGDFGECGTFRHNQPTFDQCAGIPVDPGSLCNSSGMAPEKFCAYALTVAGSNVLNSSGNTPCELYVNKNNYMDIKELFDQAKVKTDEYASHEFHDVLRDGVNSLKLPLVLNGQTTSTKGVTHATIKAVNRILYKFKTNVDNWVTTDWDGLKSIQSEQITMLIDQMIAEFNKSGQYHPFKQVNENGIMQGWNHVKRMGGYEAGNEFGNAVLWPCCTYNNTNMCQKINGPSPNFRFVRRA